jgi:uncharacterized protein YjbI with pentapeptide repeats
MANEEHVAQLKKGVAAWNAWRDENPSIFADLDRAFLQADLSGARFIRTSFYQADLSGASNYQPTQLNIGQLCKSARSCIV